MNKLYGYIEKTIVGNAKSIKSYI